jgi:hypothetical protein
MDESYPQLKIYHSEDTHRRHQTSAPPNRYIGGADCGTRHGVLLDQGTVVTGPPQLWSGVRTFPASVPVDVAMGVVGLA